MKVLNFGSINIDYVYEMPHFVEPKETIACISSQTNIGGKGLNQAIACKKAGIDLYFAGRMGEDGLFIKDYLEKEGIDTKYIYMDDDRTGHAIIQTFNGENCIIIAGGANQKIDFTMIDTILNDFEKGDILILQNEISNMLYLMKQAYEKGMRIFMNVAPMDENVFNYPLEYVDTFIVNEIEGKALSKSKHSEYEAILSDLEKTFPNQAILMTVGSDGSYYSKCQNRIYQPAYKVEAIDSTAAGDTFMGFFISSIVNGYDMKKALEIATKASSITVQREGAAKSIPTWKEVIEQ